MSHLSPKRVMNHDGKPMRALNTDIDVHNGSLWQVTSRMEK